MNIAIQFNELGMSRLSKKTQVMAQYIYKYAASCPDVNIEQGVFPLALGIFSHGPQRCLSAVRYAIHIQIKLPFRLMVEACAGFRKINTQ